MSSVYTVAADDDAQADLSSYTLPTAGDYNVPTAGYTLPTAGYTAGYTVPTAGYTAGYNVPTAGYTAGHYPVPRSPQSPVSPLYYGDTLAPVQVGCDWWRAAGHL